MSLPILSVRVQEEELLARGLHSRCLATFPGPPAEELRKESQFTPDTQKGEVLGCEKDLKLRSCLEKAD